MCSFHAAMTDGCCAEGGGGDGGTHSTRVSKCSSGERTSLGLFLCEQEESY